VTASGEPLLEFLEVMRRLRAECSWKAGQTHRSLARYLLEETHETLEAIDTGDAGLLREELGDLLLQVYFHAVIVEDDVEVRDWIAHCMLPDGHELRGVTDGRQVRALHVDEPDYRPDLVLMDFSLPDTDGVDLLAEIQDFWSE